MKRFTTTALVEKLPSGVEILERMCNWALYPNSMLQNESYSG